MRQVSGFLLAAGLLAAVGCGGQSGGGDGVPVAGTIKVNGEPAANAVVTYLPQGSTTGHGGTGMTDSTGRYEVSSPQGQKGLPAGTYKVTVSRRLNPDGSAPSPDEPPIESKARETLPDRYTSPEKTELSVTLSAGDKRSFDFDLKTAKKK